MSRALGVAAALGAGAVAADPPHTRARPATTTAFRDWAMQCLGADCRIRTEVRAAGGAELLGLVVGSAEDALEVRTRLPLYLPDGVTLAVGGDPPRLAAWRTCDASGCVAVAPFEDDLLGALKRERAIAVTFTLLDGVRVRLPASLLGFSAAAAALGSAAKPEPSAPVNPP